MIYYNIEYLLNGEENSKEIFFDSEPSWQEINNKIDQELGQVIVKNYTRLD
jgi:hypothetical protein